MKSMTKNNVFLVIAREKRFKKKGPPNVEEDDETEMGDALIGTVELQLFDDDCPRTAKNFRTLCSGEKGKGKSGVKLWYQGSPLHRCVGGAFVQGGDFIKGTGSYGESIYGDKFKDEPKGLKYPIEEPGLLAMANSGKNSNTSQFFITVAPQPQLTGHHVVFGRVVRGLDVIQKVLAIHAELGNGKDGWKEGNAVPFVWKCGVM
jgi:peptidylprolyl isomerase